MRRTKAERADFERMLTQYATSERSDTFASYNSSIELAKEVLRLRRMLVRVRRRK